MSRQMIVKCDICKEEIETLIARNANFTGVPERKEIEVIFTTEQTEGRSTTPYLSSERIDICNKCLRKKLEGIALYAWGAQGYNEYSFKEDK